MLTVSLHGIKLHAIVGLYPEERIIGNNFITDVDLFLDDALPWFYADYTLIRETVAAVFAEEDELLETVVAKIHAALRITFPPAQKIRVSVKKLNPPMPTEVAYAMVSYEA
jgi:7,8-dihydroneopterin aldolase/epimerase/oxygenase